MENLVETPRHDATERVVPARAHRFAVVAGRVYELRTLSSRPNGGEVGLAAIWATFRDAGGAVLDPRLAGQEMRVPHLDPIEVETLPVTPEGDALAAAGMASRFVIPPPDATDLDLVVETPDVAVHRFELSPLGLAWRSEGKLVLTHLKEAGDLRLELLRRHLPEQGAAAQALLERLVAVPAAQARAIRAQFQPVGDWEPTLARLAAAPEDAPGGEAQDFEERVRRRARERVREVRVGFVGSPRTLARLRCLAEVFVLREAVWEAQLDALSLDRIVVETAAEPSSGDWHAGLCGLDGALPEAGRALAEGARARGVPLCLLVTAGPGEMGVWRGLAERADAVVIEGDAAAWPDPPPGAAFVRRATEPMANPALRTDAALGTLLVPVASDVYQSPDFAALFQRGTGYAALFTEVDYDLVPRSLADRLVPAVFPAVATTSRGRLCELMQASAVVLLHGRSVRSDGQLVDIALDAVAAGAIPVVHGPCDVSHPLVAGLDRVWSRADLDELLRLYRIPWLRERRWRALWREVCRHHVWTGEERAAVLGADPFAEGHDTPLMSAILVSKRPHLIESSLATFRRQTAPAKELILVLHMDRAPDVLPELHEGERLFVAPRSWNLGRCLNMAIAQARGRFWAKIDDDDSYVPTYLEELAHYARATQADAVGRQAIYFHLAGEDRTYGRLIFGRRCFRHLPKGAGVAGAALSAARAEGVPPFSNRHRNGSDSEWVQSVHAAGCRFVCYDGTSFTMRRSADQSLHTWQMRDVTTAGRGAYRIVCEGNIDERLEAPGTRLRD